MDHAILNALDGQFRDPIQQLAFRWLTFAK